jgi:hypothetical protein
MRAFIDAIGRPATKSAIEQALEQGWNQRSEFESDLGTHVAKLTTT